MSGTADGGAYYPFEVPEEICELFDIEINFELPILGVPYIDFVEELIRLLKTALGPLIPFFRVLDVIVQIYKCAQAVPDAIVELDPTDLFTCLGELGRKIAQLLEMAPWLAVPILIVKIIDLLIAFLQKIKRRLEYQLWLLRQIFVAIDQAANINDGRLQGLLTCAHGNMQGELDELTEILRGIGQLIGVINILMDLAGVPEEAQIPELTAIFDAGSESTIQEGLDAMDDFIEILRTARSLVPLP